MLRIYKYHQQLPGSIFVVQKNENYFAKKMVQTLELPIKRFRKPFFKPKSIFRNAYYVKLVLFTSDIEQRNQWAVRHESKETSF